MDPLNVALAKAGVYNVLMQKQVTAWADLRNKAAHAQWDQYDAEQVSQMLVGVRKFCMDYLPAYGAACLGIAPIRASLVRT